MNVLNDVITYVRRIIKSMSNSEITDSLLIDYINRFWINDVDARMQLFDLKKKYSFITSPGVDQYNMPFYSLQTESPSQNPQSIGRYPVYQGFLAPAYVNGVQIAFHTQKGSFYNVFPNIVQNFSGVARGTGEANYTFQLPLLPNSAPQNPPFNMILRGHVDIQGIIATNSDEDPPIANIFNTLIPVTSVDSKVYITALDQFGNNQIMADSGQFFEFDVNKGLLMIPGKAPLGNQAAPNNYLVDFTITGVTQAVQAVVTVGNTLSPGQQVFVSGVVGMTELNGNVYTVVSATSTTVTLNVDSTGFTPYISDGTLSVSQNFVDYQTGEINVTFPSAIPSGNNINVSVLFFSSGLPRAILFYNNTLVLRSPPDKQYLVELDAYMSPAGFLTTEAAIPFGYMSEYIARGAARKILSDTGDVEQFQFYEPLFREQELLVWKRSQRQWTATRTETIYSQGFSQGNAFNGNGGSF